VSQTWKEGGSAVLEKKGGVQEYPTQPRMSKTATDPDAEAINHCHARSISQPTAG